MKILTIGDTHFKTKNIVEVDLFIERIIVIAKEHQPDYIILLGDILDTHERVFTVPLNKAYNMIHGLREIAKLFILVGNHDMISCSQFLTEHHWMNGMKEWENVTIVDKPIIHENFCMLPYVPPGRFKEALNTLENDWSEMDAIFAHQEFRGCKMGAIISEIGDEWLVDDPYVISGHIHSKQQPQENMYYTGSSMQCAFGENERASVAIVTLDDGVENIEEIYLNLPRKRICYKSMEELFDIDLSIVDNTEDILKFSVTGAKEEFSRFKKTKKYKELIKRGCKIAFKPKRIRSVDEYIGDIDTTDFHTILRNSVWTEKNPYLIEAFEYAVNENIVPHTEVMFMN
jgi:DNA repair exonuclease SbcCD nuclease subunit